jgi:hypothetical protein
MPTMPSDTESTGTSSDSSQPRPTKQDIDRLVPRSALGDWDTPSGNPLELVRYNVALDEVIARFREAKLQSQFIPQQFEMVGTDTDFDLFFEGTIIATLRFRVKAPSAVKVETPLQMPPKAERNHTPPPPSDSPVDAKREDGVKFDSDKVPLALLPAYPLQEVARVLAVGAKKYHPWNWTGGFAASRLVSPALGHILAWMSGEDNDPETGLSHLAHAVCCLLFLIENYAKKPKYWNDDRPHGKVIIPKR